MSDRSIPHYFEPQKPGQAGDVYLVTVDGEVVPAEGVREMDVYRWLNTVHIPGELSTHGFLRAWSLRSVLPMRKQVPEAGDRGAYLTLYEVRSDDIAAALAARRERIERAGAAVVQEAAAQCVKERAVIAYRAVGGLMTRSNTPPAPYANKATPSIEEPPPVPGTRRFLLAVEANVTDTAHEADFDTWYNTVHIPDVLTSPGYRGVMRFERVTADAPGRGRYLTFYEIHTDDLAKAVQARDERRIREYMIGGYEGGGRYVAPWAHAYYEPMGEVISGDS